MFRAICLMTAFVISGVAFAQDDPPATEGVPSATDVTGSAETEPARGDEQDRLGTPASDVEAGKGIRAEVQPDGPSASAAPEPDAPAAEEPLSLEGKVDKIFGTYLVSPIATVFFWTIPFIQMPLVVFWLLMGATFFTLRMGFVNVRMFRHAVDLVAGKYDDETSEGEVTHFRPCRQHCLRPLGLETLQEWPSR